MKWRLHKKSIFFDSITLHLKMICISVCRKRELDIGGVCGTASRSIEFEYIILDSIKLVRLFIAKAFQSQEQFSMVNRWVRSV